MSTPTVLVRTRSRKAGSQNFLLHHPQANFYRDFLVHELAGEVVGEGLGALAEVDGRIDNMLCWKADDGLLEQLTSLDWIQTTSAGVDQLMPHLWHVRPETEVATVSGMNADSVAGFGLTALLSLHWQIPRILENQRAKRWELHAARPFKNCSVAVVGLGNIGGRVAEHCAHLGMEVVGVSRRPTAHSAVSRSVAIEDLDTVLPDVDYLMLCVPLTDGTKDLIDARRLALLAPGSCVINVGRGGVVNEDALNSALRSGHIAGAAVDVFTIEPLPTQHPLWEAPNLMVSAHLAGERTDYREAVSEIWLDNIRRRAAGERLRGLVPRC